MSCIAWFHRIEELNCIELGEEATWKRGWFDNMWFKTRMMKEGRQKSCFSCFCDFLFAGVQSMSLRICCLFWMLRTILRSPVCLGITRNLQLFSNKSVSFLKRSCLRQFGSSSSSCLSTDLQEKIMKLFTDKGNPFALKVLSACNVCDVKMELQVVDKKS